MKRFILTMTLAVPALACGGGQKTNEGQLTAHGPVVQYPEWVNKGSGAFGGEKQVLYGVGAASGIRNHALARTTSDNRARAEVSKILQTYSASLMKDYSASTTAGDFSQSSEEQHVEQAIKTFSANTLNGVEIVDHWIHPTDGTIYALARCDLAGFMDQISKAKELSKRVKEAVKRSAERSFANLEAEEEKAQNRE